MLLSIDELLDGYVPSRNSIAVPAEATPRALDRAVGSGERTSDRLVGAVLRRYGLPAQAFDPVELVVSDSCFQHATSDLEVKGCPPETCLVSAPEAGQAPMATGFIGATVQGLPTTLRSGGLDYSATVLAACLDRDEVWI